LDAGFARGLKEASPTTLIVGRLHLEQLNLDVDPQPLVQDYVNTILPVATDPNRMTAFDAWEAYNEPVADTATR